MPCNSDYMGANRSEIEASRLYALLEEAESGVPVDAHSREWEGYHPLAYGKSTTEDDFDRLVMRLCDYCTSHDVSNSSLEMQIWWRDHQKADIDRLAEERLKAQKEHAMEDEILAKADSIRARRAR